MATVKINLNFAITRIDQGAYQVHVENSSGETVATGAIFSTIGAAAANAAAAARPYINKRAAQAMTNKNGGKLYRFFDTPKGEFITDILDAGQVHEQFVKIYNAFWREHPENTAADIWGKRAREIIVWEYDASADAYKNPESLYYH